MSWEWVWKCNVSEFYTLDAHFFQKHVFSRRSCAVLMLGVAGFDSLINTAGS